MGIFFKIKFMDFKVHPHVKGEVELVRMEKCTNMVLVTTSKDENKK